MEEQNPYRSPQSVVADATGEGELASLGARFAAALIDAVILLVIVLPLMYVGGYFEAVQTAAIAGTQPYGAMALWAVIGIVIFVLVQGLPLSQTGQTWGKKVLSIKIVDLEGGKPPFGKLIGLRYLPVQLVSNIPVLGPIAALVDILFIFRADRRCVHDLIAGTRVVKTK